MPSMLVESPRKSQSLFLERGKSLFQQMLEERLALAEQVRQCAAEPKDLPGSSEDKEESEETPLLDTKLIGLDLEEMATALDETRKQAERTLRRMQQVMTRVRKGQEEALAILRRSLSAFISLNVVPPQVLSEAERKEILQTMVELHGAEIPPDGMVYRLYREDVATSFFVLSDRRVLALKDGTIGSAEDRDELISLVMSELHAREAVFTQGIEDLKSTLEEMKQRFLTQLSATSATLKMQRL